MTDRLECERLVLQIERDLVAQLNLRVLLAAADAALARRHADLRTVRARIKRDSRRPPRARNVTRAGRSK